MSKDLPTTRFLTLLLAALTAVTPLAVDMYLPAMKQMAIYFAQPIHIVELSLSIFLVGYAFGQLLGGPASDKYGRKPTMNIGLSAFIIFSLLLAHAQTIEEVMIYRGLQAFAGGIAVVNSGAMIRDLFSGKRIAQMFSMIAVIMMIAPLLAPLIGATLVKIFDWHSIFYVLAAYAAIVLLITNIKLPETRDKNLKLEAPWHNYWSVLTHQYAMAYVFAITMAFSGMFVFLTASPFAYMQYFSVDEHMYSYLFACNIITMIILNRVNVWALNRYSSQQILVIGQLIQLTSALILLISSQFYDQLILVVIANAIFVGSIGLVAGNAVAGCLQYFPNISGTANALIGVIEFLGGALAGIAWTVWHDSLATPDLSPMAGMMVVCSSLGLLLFHVLKEKPANDLPMTKGESY